MVVVFVRLNSYSACCRRLVKFIVNVTRHHTAAIEIVTDAALTIIAVTVRQRPELRLEIGRRSSFVSPRISRGRLRAVRGLVTRFEPPSDLQLNRGASGSVELRLFLLRPILVNAFFVVLIVDGVAFKVVLVGVVSVGYLVFVLMVVRGGWGEGLATTAYQL